MSKRQAGTMKMHESAALLLCRSAFVALGLLPLWVVILWSVAEFVPAYRSARAARWASAISTQLGVTVKIASVTQVAPRRFVLEGIVLSHPETQHLLANVPQAAASQVGQDWSVRCSSGEVALAQMPQLWDRTHDLVLCRPGQLSGSIVIAFDTLLVDGPSKQYEFGPSQAALVPKENEQKLHILLTQAERNAVPFGIHSVASHVDASEDLTLRPSSVTVSRKIANGQPQTTISIEAVDSPLPCSIAYGIAPELKMLGDEALFQGSVALSVWEQGWGMWLNTGGVDPQTKRVRFRDKQATTFSQVDFGRLTDGTEANIRGEGTLTFDRAYLADYGVQEAVGTMVVDSQQNSIDATFLEHACSTLDLETNLEFSHATLGMSYAFSRLAVEYVFEGNRLRLQGDQNGFMLFDPHDRPRVARGGPKWQEFISIGKVVAAIDRTAAESQSMNGALLERDLPRLVRRWLPVYSSPLVAIPNEVDGDAPRTQTASASVPSTH